MSELRDEVAIVTGAATGVGRALALDLAARGVSVVVTDIDDEGGAKLVAEIEAQEGRASFVHVDVRRPRELDAAVDKAKSAFGPVTIAVANAMAGGAQGTIWQQDPEGASATFDVLVFGVFTAVRQLGLALLDTAKEGKPARLLVVGSEHSLGVPPHVFPLSAYTVAKYATLGIVDTARRDFEGTGVTATLLAPSWVRTEKVRELIATAPDVARVIEPYAQDASEVACLGVDGLLRADYITATNPVIRQFAIDHARGVIAAVQMLPAPVEEEHAHDGTGDASKCPIVGHF